MVLSLGQPKSPTPWYKGFTYHAICLNICRLHLRSLLNRLLANNLNPVAIRVQCKGNVVHAPICQLLLEFVASVLDTLARSLNVINADASVAEATVGLFVPIVDGVVGVILGAVVVRQLDDALAIGEVVSMGQSLGAVIGHEIEVELCFRVLELLNDFHAQELVEFDWTMVYLLAGAWEGVYQGVSAYPTPWDP